MSLLSLLGLDPKQEVMMQANGTPSYSAKGSPIDAMMHQAQIAQAQAAAKKAASSPGFLGNPAQVDTSKIPTAARQGTFGSQGTPVPQYNGAGMDWEAHADPNSQSSIFAGRLGSDAAQRGLVGVNRALSSARDPSMSGATREAFRSQAMELDPRSLSNGGAGLGGAATGAVRFDNGGIVAGRPGASSSSRGGMGYGSRGIGDGGPQGMPKRNVAPNPALREAAIRRETAFQKSLRDRYGDGSSDSDNALKEAQLREQQLRNKSLILQNNAFNSDRAADEAYRKKQQLLQLLQIAGGLRY